jgi:hypothetical protein
LVTHPPFVRLSIDHQLIPIRLSSMDYNRGSNAWQADPVERFLALQRSHQIVDRQGEG